MNHSFKIFLMALAFCVGVLSHSNNAQAFSCPNSGDSQSFMDNHCGIWICAAGGFPASCGAQKRTFISRIKKRRCAPLPPYGSCSSTGSGSYKMGYERFEDCKAGYRLVETNSGDRGGRDVSGRCVNTDRSCERQRGRDESDRSRCGDYAAQKRAKPNYIDIKVNGHQYDRQWW